MLDKQFDRCSKILVLAGNDDSKRSLGDALSAKLAGKANYPISAKTTIGLIQDEVLLFYPLLIQKLNLPYSFSAKIAPRDRTGASNKIVAARLSTAELARNCPI